MHDDDNDDYDHNDNDDYAVLLLVNCGVIVSFSKSDMNAHRQRDVATSLMVTGK